MRDVSDRERSAAAGEGCAPGPDSPGVAAAVRAFLLAIGEDPERPGLVRTPERVAQAAAELLGGTGVDPVPALVAGRILVPGHAETGQGLRTAQPVQPVLVRGTSFRSMCEHHLLPFTGTVSIAYVPDAHIVGFGRVHDLVETVTCRLSLQERIGDEIVDALMAGLSARGALALVRAEHGCVALRGARHERGDVLTVSARGLLAEPAGRAEIMALLAADAEAGPASHDPG